MKVQYCAVSAKLKAMRRGSLTKRDFETMVKKPNVTEVFNYLKTETVYADVLGGETGTEIHRGRLEALLSEEALKKFLRVYKFLTLEQQKFAKLWFRRNETAYLCNCIRYIFNGEQHRELNIPEQVKDFLRADWGCDVSAGQNAPAVAEVREACKNSDYYDMLTRANSANADCFSLCMTIDSFYYTTLWHAKDKYLSTDEAKLIASLFGARIDLLNIIWIYRGKKYFDFKSDMIYTYLIPVRGSLKPENIKAMVDAETIDMMIAAARETKYAPLFEDYEDSGWYIEERYRRMCKQIASRMLSEHPDSMAAIISYFYLCEAEIDDITSTIEGVRYSLPEATIMQHIF